MKKENWRIILNIIFILLGLIAIVLPITFGILNLINEEYSDPWYWMQIFLMPFGYCAFLFLVNFGLQKLIFKNKKTENKKEGKIIKQEKNTNKDFKLNNKDSEIKKIKIIKNKNIFKNLIWMFVFFSILMLFASWLWLFIDTKDDYPGEDVGDKLKTTAICFGIIFSSLSIIYNFWIILFYFLKKFNINLKMEKKEKISNNQKNIVEEIKKKE